MEESKQADEVRRPIANHAHVDRFLANVNQTESCWLWTASLQGNGRVMYGAFQAGGKRYRSHRFAYETWVAPIPPGMYVCHRCDVPKCVNPDHLFIGTHLDNIQDCHQKGRISNGRASKTHCVKGHALSGDNLYQRKDSTWRQCKACADINRGRIPNPKHLVGAILDVALPLEQQEGGK